SVSRNLHEYRKYYGLKTPKHLNDSTPKHSTPLHKNSRYLETSTNTENSSVSKRLNILIQIFLHSISYLCNLKKKR
ncbi:MAG: hypothetical protein JJU02_00075, partial [Cryomorphaceae bacterium]|nr:hypothetical protein [Cryomorphaceae bacterium]